MYILKTEDIVTDNMVRIWRQNELKGCPSLSISFAAHLSNASSPSHGSSAVAADSASSDGPHRRKRGLRDPLPTPCTKLHHRLLKHVHGQTLAVMTDLHWL